MKRESRPADYPVLNNYTPTRFMLPTSHYDEKMADRAVRFIEMLPHTKAEWEGKPFWLLPWQARIIRDVFGILREDGTRQFRTVYIEIPKKQGKSELAAAITLYFLYADNEPAAEVFSAAADRAQASIVFDVAKRMVELTPGLSKRSKIMAATKRIVNYSNSGYYQVVSADVANKHGWMRNPHCRSPRCMPVCACWRRRWRACRCTCTSSPTREPGRSGRQTTLCIRWIPEMTAWKLPRTHG